MFRNLIIICLFLASAYGCAVILLQNYPLYFESDWRHYTFMLSPWIFLLFTIKGWHRCFIWRRMLDARQSTPVLSRGAHVVTSTQAKTSILERLCLSFMLLALAAVFKTLFIQNIEWWIVSLVFSCLFFRIVLMTVRRL